MTMALAMAISVAVISCKKEQQHTPPDEEQVMQNVLEGQEAIEHILNFKKQVAYYKNHPGVKDSETLSVDDAIWNIEALFNYTYAYPELFYGNMVTADTTLCLPLISDSTVLLSDLTVFYGQMCEAIRDIYRNIDLPNKQFVILDASDGERVDLQQTVVLHCVLGSVRGTQPPVPLPVVWAPFSDTVSWRYGEKGGRRDGFLDGKMDAADTLANMLTAILVPHAPAGQEYVYTGIIMKELVNGHHVPFSHNLYPGEYCEFYVENAASDDEWLSADQLNFQYYGERHLILNVLPNYVEGGQVQVPSNYSFFRLYIDDYYYYPDQSKTIGHHTEAYYGQRNTVYHNLVDKDILD